MDEVLVSSMHHDQRDYLERRFRLLGISWAAEYPESIRETGFNLFVKKQHYEIAERVCSEAGFLRAWQRLELKQAIREYERLTEMKIEGDRPIKLQIKS